MRHSIGLLMTIVGAFLLIITLAQMGIEEPESGTAPVAKYQQQDPCANFEEDCQKALGLRQKRGPAHRRGREQQSDDDCGDMEVRFYIVWDDRHGEFVVVGVYSPVQRQGRRPTPPVKAKNKKFKKNLREI